MNLWLQEKSTAPEWDETFVIELEPGGKPLLLEVFDHNSWCV